MLAMNHKSMGVPNLLSLAMEVNNRSSALGEKDLHTGQWVGFACTNSEGADSDCDHGNKSSLRVVDVQMWDATNVQERITYHLCRFILC